MNTAEYTWQDLMGGGLSFPHWLDVVIDVHLAASSGQDNGKQLLIIIL